MPKALVDAIEGISPAVAIEQKNPTTSSRSIVGTATEIYDYLRLLWARIGRVHCVECGGDVRADTVEQVVDAISGDRGIEGSGDRTITIAFPMPPAVKAKHDQI